MIWSAQNAEDVQLLIKVFDMSTFRISALHELFNYKAAETRDRVTHKSGCEGDVQWGITALVFRSLGSKLSAYKKYQ